MPFDALPNEIVHQIAEQTLPEGIGAFALTCRRFHSIAFGGETSIVAVHKAYRKRWRETYNRLERPTHFEPARLVAAIAKDPLVALYLEYMDVRHWGSVPAELYWSLQVIMQDQSLTERIKSMVIGSRYLRDAGVNGEEWCQEMFSPTEFESKEEFKNYRHERSTNYRSNPFVLWKAFLLTLLPNIKAARIQPGFVALYDNARYSRKDEVGRVMRKIVEVANHQLYMSPAFGKLQFLITGDKTDYSTLIRSQPDIYPLLRLNTVRTIRGSVPVGEGPYDTADVLVGENIDAVEVDGDTVDLSFLRKSWNFKTLRIARNRSSTYLYHFDAGGILDMIQKSLGERLQHLTFCCLKEIHGVDEIKTGIRTFRGFPCLKSLDVDVSLFLGRIVEQAVAGTEITQRIPTWEELPRLVDILPRSIEDVTILTRARPEVLSCTNALVERFVEEATSKLPSLASLKIILVPMNKPGSVRSEKQSRDLRALRRFSGRLQTKLHKEKAVPVHMVLYKDRPRPNFLYTDWTKYVMKAGASGVGDEVEGSSSGFKLFRTDICSETDTWF